MRYKAFSYGKGISLPKLNAYVENDTIVKLPLPHMAVVPLKQCKGPVPTVMVGLNEKVKVGTVLARSAVSTIISPVAGNVNRIEKRPSCYGGICDHILINVDANDEQNLLPPIDYAEATKDAILKRIEDLGLVDYDGTPLQLKLKLTENDHISSLVINACTDEPFLINNIVLAKEKADEIIDGAAYLAKAIKVNNISFVITKSMFAKFGEFTEKLKSLEGELLFDVFIVPDKYPVGDEIELVKALTKKEMNINSSPKEFGMVIVDIASCYSVHCAMIEGRGDTEKLITVVGTGLNGNEIQCAWTRVGTTFEEIMNRMRSSGERNVLKIIAGGPMRGVSVAGVDVCTTKTLKAVMFLNGTVLSTEKESPCIGCGKCVDVCPRGLMPYRIEEYAESEDYYMAKKYGATYCTKCGCCAYVCPAKRNLVQRIVFAKDTIKDKGV